MRTGKRRAVDHTNTGDIQPIQQPVKQWSVATGARDVECVEDAVLEDVRFIQLRGGEKLARLVSYPAQIQRHVLRQFSLNREVEILNVRGHPMIGIAGNVRSSIGERNCAKRFGAARWHRHDTC